MWFAILTAGAHECRPHPRPGELTIYTWTDVARKRVDGPAAGVQTGLRRLREIAREAGEETFTPRCFVCRAEYVLPDPEEALADAQDLGARGADGDVELDDVPPARQGDAAGRPRPDEQTTMFVCVHIPDAPPEPGEEEEALVVVPTRRLALAVPLDALPLMLEILGSTARDEDLLRCPDCGTLAPGSTRSPDAARPGRAERRAAARAARGCGRPGRRAA